MSATLIQTRSTHDRGPQWRQGPANTTFGEDWPFSGYGQAAWTSATPISRDTIWHEMTPSYLLAFPKLASEWLNADVLVAQEPSPEDDSSPV